MTLDELLNTLPKNQTIVDNYIRAWQKINDPKYKKILCSTSAGSDSDIVLDICTRCDIDHKIDYVWFDVGLDWNATKEHLTYLEEKYNIEIQRLRPAVTIPASCKKNGQPFLDKSASEMLERLQRHDFEFEDLPYEELLKKYCTWNEKKQQWVGCKSALDWWCNKNKEGNLFNIQKRPWLKEFLLENPPDFKISNKCCQVSKKDLVKNFLKTNSYDLNIYGIRKAEGGVRINAKTCFNEKDHGPDDYRPIFWYSDDDKREYIKHFDIILSDCYTVYGLPRTGCCGCPFAGRNLQNELETIQKFEPKLHKACMNVFGTSYNYTDKYREYADRRNDEDGSYREWLKNKEV